MTALLLIMVGVLGFVVGWVAHREENSRYRESRERHWQRQLTLTLAQRADERAETIRVPAPDPAPPAVVHVHLPALPQGLAWPRHQPAIAPVDLDALTAKQLDRGGA